jgi:hypothetical protein
VSTDSNLVQDRGEQQRTDTRVVTATRLKRAASASIVLALLSGALCLVKPAPAVDLTEPQGAAHAYPALLDRNGKKLADGEFRQWIQNDRLRIKIDYEFTDGQHFEENAVLRQKPELIEEEWSLEESKNGKVSREFRADFLAKTATALTQENNESKQSSQKIEVEPGRTFAGFGFTLAIENLRKRLINGEKVELKAVGFAPKPQVITVQISHGGVDKMKMSGRLLKGDRFVIHPEIPLIAKLFVHVPDTQIWLTNPPAGFLRWEGPTVLPSDPITRVDLVSGAKSGTAEPVRTSGRQ